MFSNLRWLLRRTFPVIVLTGLLAAGWGLLTAPAQPGGSVASVHSGEASLWGARVAAGSLDSWAD